jgi:hypothetical protein
LAAVVARFALIVSSPARRRFWSVLTSPPIMLLVYYPVLNLSTRKCTGLHFSLAFPIVPILETLIADRRELLFAGVVDEIRSFIEGPGCNLAAVGAGGGLHFIVDVRFVDHETILLPGFKPVNRKMHQAAFFFLAAISFDFH